MQFNKVQLVLAASLITVFSSCSKNDASPSSSQSAGSFQLRAMNSSITTLGTSGTQGNSITWISGTAGVDMAKFEAKNAGAEVELKSRVQQTIDLFSADFTFGSLNLPAATYNEIEIKAYLSSEGGNPSIELKGKFDNNGSIKNITFRSDESIEIKGEKNNVTIDGGTVFNALTVINLALASQGITASALLNATVTNGEILISSSINSNLYQTIVSNLRNMHEEAEFHHH